MAALAEIWLELQAIYRRKWAQDILFTLSRGPRRYTDIQTEVIVARGQALHPHTLSNTLEWLQEQAYIERRQHDGNAEYCLTTDGEDLVRILGEINRMYRRRKNRDE